MDPALRSRFNADFTPDKYEALLRCVNETEKWPADFRISETPIFLTRDFTDDVTRARDEIVDLTRTPEFARHAADAIPAGLEVPNETAHPNFLVVDFGICEIDGRLVATADRAAGVSQPLRFPTARLHCLRKAYPAIPRNWTSSFGGMKDEAYLKLLRRIILGDSNPENVILLEIEPEKQKTRIDFACTETLLGVRPVCLTKISKRGRQLFYERDGARCGSSASTTASFSMNSCGGRISTAVPFSGRARREMGRASELVFPDQQTFAAVPENGTHVAGVFRGRISAERIAG